VKDGFAHFDGSHRENFSAAVLLLAMEVDPAVALLVSQTICARLDIRGEPNLLAFGREARLNKTEDDDYARVDIWLLFDGQPEAFYAFVELKTHDNWDAAHVAHQVRDQSSRELAMKAGRIRGSMLLAPDRLCRRVREIDADLPLIAWEKLLQALRGLRSVSTLTTHAIRHFEEQMEHPPGINKPMTLGDFEEATTTVACLKQFLMDCVAELKGSVHGEPLYMTPGDGRPKSGGGWAWHGFAVPFSLRGQRGRIGIYKYSEVPPLEAETVNSLWLEVFLGDPERPMLSTRFAPGTLSRECLDDARSELARAWFALGQPG
jgi:hypothetical protein